MKLYTRLCQSWYRYTSSYHYYWRQVYYLFQIQ